MNCASIICHPLCTATMSKWETVADMTNVLTTPAIVKNTCIRAGHFIAEDIILPDTDCRLVGAVVIHGKENDSPIEYIDTAPAIRQYGDDTVICVDIDLHAVNPDTVPADQSEFRITKDMTACHKLQILECCYDNLACGSQKEEVWFDNRRVVFRSLSDAALERRLARLRVECAEECGNVGMVRNSGVYRCG